MNDGTPEKTRQSRHGWRGYLKEFGVIVLGVSVALAAQQAAEWWNWRGQVALAREIAATELAGDLSLAIYRMRSAQCVERRLGALADILDAATKSGSLPPVGDIGQPPMGYWSSSSWDSVVASQTATHFPRQELAAINSTYRIVAMMAERLNLEVDAWNSLYSMVGPGRRLDPASEARLRDALSQARGQNRIAVSASNRLLHQVKALNLPFSPEDLDAIAQADTMPFTNPKRTLLTGSAFGVTCAPLGPPPPAYGQAIWNFAPPLWADALKAKPRFTSGGQ